MENLVVFTHKPFRDTLDGMKTTGGFTIQMDALAPYFKHVTLCVPVIHEPEFQGVGIISPNISFHPLPYYEGRRGFLRASFLIHNEINKAIKNADLGLILMPSYVGLFASVVCQRHRFPIFQWIVGNWSRNIVTIRSNSRSRWFVSKIISPIISWVMKRLTRDILTFYNGQILYDQGKHYHYLRTSSSIHERDFYTQYHELSSPARLLFVGRLSPEKGVPDLLQATAFLVERGEDVMLTIAGAGELESALSKQAEHLRLNDRVRFLGNVPMGMDLFNVYRSNDMLVLPSHDDQQPKVLLEAMSQALPVIATKVGGIPSIIQDGVNGLLIPPGQPKEIVESCKRLLTDKKLRQQLVDEGLKFAGEHTVEYETELMMELVREHFGIQT